MQEVYATEKVNVREISRFCEDVDKVIREIGECTFVEAVGEKFEFWL